MIEARLSLTKSLEILMSQIQNNKFRNIVEDILAQVKGGTSFARSLSFHRNVFSNLYINMVNVGEVAGVLDLTLNRLAAHLEKIATLKRKLMTAMSYPAVIILVAIGAITFLLTAIVPTFADMFHDFGAELPMLTRLIIDIGEGVKSYGIFFIIFFVVAILFIRRYTETGTGKLLKDKLLLLLPLWGNFLKKILISRFCRTLGTLLESGVSLLEALEVAAGISGNKVFEIEIHQMKQYATRGGFIADSVLNSTIFPPIVSQMMHVGEETAKLEVMSHKIADFYDEEVNATIDTLTSIIEPVIIVFLGIILGGTVVAMYLQIFNLMDVIQ
jgi:type IV pilus assembly protein PilC